MRLVQYRANGESRLGLVVGDGAFVDVASAAEKAGRDAAPFQSTLALLESGPDALEFVRTLGVGQDVVHVDGRDLDFPVAAKKIVAIGLNYLDHAKEAGQSIPKTPLCFAKFTSSLSGPYDPIRLPDAEAQVDFEGELGVVIGKRAHRVAESEAMEYVAGYVVFNDVSERRSQFADGQWTRGKSCDTFSPNGPYLVTRDEVADPGNLRITTRVNGAVMQDSNTNQLIFKIPELISYLSHSFTFHPGDIIATGTPPGVGFSRKPPLYLREGDLVEVEIESVGRIANRVERGY
ncbi:5-carboxymethyl-2-hydroxymuconate delta-isomerase [Candidatus Koribacter versatilis Ellin345]|uniref:5-carboxymethyl-2-hydroxymuconate delta-isomerase n=1 Tax=Koribacter versatilis (strain Ellin345) TaxID=204669 RepID=Q1ITZ8_KORVE|nr:fumarylacetoacetate hydrolase family protein [Candidatus Koribacter versatilis]ABF39652.1 5-carboxymethyl-2-hydroxymuconate delta-isomerase [Candidatus Koribacter versatilis Ellin345]